MYRTVVKKRIEKAKKDLVSHYEDMKDDIHQKMESYLEKGYLSPKKSKNLVIFYV